MSHFIRSLTPHRPAEGRGRSGLIHVTTVSVERFPYQDVMKLSAFSKRRSDTVDPPLFLVLSTGDMKRLHKVIGDLLASPLANRQSSQTEEEIAALGLIRTQSAVNISVEREENDNGSRQASENDTGEGSADGHDEGALAGVSPESGAAETGRTSEPYYGSYDSED